MAQVHDRMPVIIEPADYQKWLDPFNDKTAELKKLLRPAPDDALTIYPVGSLVNSSRVDDPKCVERWEGKPDDPSLWKE
jgi:putative SOS response-associated peptidase YedK